MAKHTRGYKRWLRNTRALRHEEIDYLLLQGEFTYNCPNNLKARRRIERNLVRLGVLEVTSRGYRSTYGWVPADYGYTKYGGMLHDELRNARRVQDAVTGLARFVQVLG